jgi:general secretion pathway protein D
VCNLRRAVMSGALFVFAAVLVSACSPGQPVIGGGGESPDALDTIRGEDLQPRFPQSSKTVNTGSPNGQRAAVYYGSNDVQATRADGGGGGDGAPAGGDGVDLNFENAPITAVAKVILGDILHVGYSIDSRVQGSITLSSGRSVPRSNLLFVLESALRANNAVLTRDASGYRILPMDDAVGNGGADRASGGHETEAGYGVTVVPVQHVSVETIMKLLEGFATRPGAVRADPSRNLILVVGNGVERRSAVDTILSFDEDWMRGQSVGIFPVRNTTPEPVITELEKILDSGEAGLSQNLVKLQPMSRSNSILVVARKPELLRAAGTWISRLDSSATASTGVKVYRVRYGDARTIAKLLNDLFIGGAGSGSLDSAANSLAPGGGAAGLSTTDRLTGGAPASGAGGSSGGFGSSSGGGFGSSSGSGGLGSSSGSSGGLGSGSGSSGGLGSGMGGSGGGGSQPFGSLGGGSAGGDAASGRGGPGGADGFTPSGGGASKGPSLLPGVRIMADIANNAVVIYANQENYRIIEKALDQLDRPQLQVAVDVTVAEVTLNDMLNYGVQFFLGHTLGSSGTNPTTGAAQTTQVATFGVGNIGPAGLPLQGGQGFNLLLGSQFTPNFVLNALHSYTDTKILSNPSLVVIDNQVATLQVGDQVPVQTGSATVLSANNAVVNTIDYRDTGIILRVQPRINANGNVLLSIEQEISEQVTATTTLGPTFSDRKVKSSILVPSGQTVLLAGLIQDNHNSQRDGIPVVDQIPVFGSIFNNTAAKNIARTELIIFIRPQIIRDSIDASFVAEELRSKLRGNKVGSVAPQGAVEPIPQRALQ